MHVLVIEYSGRVVPESTASYIEESAIEKSVRRIWQAEYCNTQWAFIWDEAAVQWIPSDS